jgi:GntR family transcriptional regulator
MPMEFATPKYAVIVNTLQARIEDGAYVPGDMLPSETALMQEFGASRPIVVRALGILRQSGWIDTQQGRGRFVRARPVTRSNELPARITALLGNEAEGHVRIVDVVEAPAPPRAMAALGAAEGTSVVVRRRLVSVDGVGPVELAAAYIPMELAEGTDVRSPEPLEHGLLRHLEVRKNVQFDYVTERISARPASADESRLLEIRSRECVLTALFAVCDKFGAPMFALDMVVPPARHEFEGEFPIT